MSRFSAIDLSTLPFPDVVERLDAEAILAELKASVQAAVPELSDVLDLESEPVVKVLEVMAYREQLLRARINDAAKALSLAHAAGADLDNLVALFGIARLTVTEADLSTIPPTEAVMESDAALRSRAQLALEGFSTAGPEGSYLFHALSADGRVSDVSATSPQPGEALISLLSSEGDGTPPADLVEIVRTALEAVRPLTTQLTVQGATIVPYQVTAELTLAQGPSPQVVLDAATAAVTALVSQPDRIGRIISRSAILAALHVPNVINVSLTSPAADIVIQPSEAGHCTGVAVTEVGT